MDKQQNLRSLLSVTRGCCFFFHSHSLRLLLLLLLLLPCTNNQSTLTHFCGDVYINKKPIKPLNELLSKVNEIPSLFLTLSQYHRKNYGHSSKYQPLNFAMHVSLLFVLVHARKRNQIATFSTESLYFEELSMKSSHSTVFIWLHYTLTF